MTVAEMIAQRTTELTAIKADSNAAVAAKGGTPADNLLGIPAAIASIPSGGELPELTTPAEVGHVVAGKEYIDGNGNKRAGTLVVCDTIEEVETLGVPGTGVSVDIESSADGSASMLTLREPNLLPENIKSGVNIFGVLGTLSLGLFDDEIDCEIGTFELAEDEKEGYVVSLKRTDIEPYMIVVWTDDPKFKDDSGNQLHYKIGGVFIKSSLSYIASCAGLVSVNGGIAEGTGVNNSAYRVYPSSGGIYIGSSSYYPLKAGIKYKWIARWLS